MMSFLLISVVLVILAFVVMIQNYNRTNWVWLGLLIASCFIGAGAFIAGAYLLIHVFGSHDEKSKTESHTNITYNPDGSYTVYGAPPPAKPASTGAVLFKVVGGVIAGAAIAFGLLIVGVVLLFTLFPSVICGGNSKGCY